MAYRKSRRSTRTTYGKVFKKKGRFGKHKKGTLIRYKYVNGRRVGTERVSARGRKYRK